MQSPEDNPEAWYNYFFLSILGTIIPKPYTPQTQSANCTVPALMIGKFTRISECLKGAVAFGGSAPTSGSGTCFMFCRGRQRSENLISMRITAF